MNILHLTPHLGGGVGTVVLNWLKQEHRRKTGRTHVVLCLDVNRNRIPEIANTTIMDGLFRCQETINQHVEWADIVIIHWWNHPMLFDVMLNHPLPPARVVVWNHVSAVHPPYVHSKDLVEYSDRFLFTSPVSFLAREVLLLPAHLFVRLGVVWSACGTEIFDDFRRQPHEGFVVGFTGTVDYGKLHPRYAEMSAMVDIPGVRFVVCSGDSQDRLKSDVSRLGIASRFSFLGRVPSIMPHLATFDVFGYPLQPKHLGTCEQALGEAMLARVVPVVMNNAAEQFIVEHEVTGFVVSNPREYADAVERLYREPALRQKMGDAAHDYARQLYSMDRKISAWNEVFAGMMRLAKRPRMWAAGDFSTGAKVFMASLGSYGEVFARGDKDEIIRLMSSNIQWLSENKGGVRQYLKVYPEDCLLKEWEGWLREITS